MKHERNTIETFFYNALIISQLLFFTFMVDMMASIKSIFTLNTDIQGKGYFKGIRILDIQI
ncbi:MAG TPA: hypothetical protein PLE74_11970 [Candidatus Cloacimonadota bacterium]|nr:hypothetical protein [Candidatus Cloacimonadota bacterium]